MYVSHLEYFKKLISQLCCATDEQEQEAACIHKLWHSLCQQDFKGEKVSKNWAGGGPNLCLLPDSAESGGICVVVLY